MRVIAIILFCTYISGCALLSTLSNILPIDNKTTGHGNNNKVLVGDNSTDIGNKIINTDDVKGDLSGRDKYNASTLTLNQTNFWELFGAAIGGAFLVIFTRLAFILMNRLLRTKMLNCIKNGIKSGRKKDQK